MDLLPNDPDLCKNTIILASSSPRRRDLLRLGGWEFRTRIADVDEIPTINEDPSVFVLRMAISKSRKVAMEIRSELAKDNRFDGNDQKKKAKEEILSHPWRHYIILAADTIVVNGKDILGKPKDEAAAVCMLAQLRSRIHQVYSAIAIASLEIFSAQHLSSNDDTFSLQTDICITDVFMRNYSDEEITEYVASGDALDKAGSYAIQNKSFTPVKYIHGCYTNVMGLPLCHVSHLLNKVGVKPPMNYQDIFYQCQTVSNPNLRPMDELMCHSCCQEIWDTKNTTSNRINHIPLNNL